jgi:hypothetical protein
MNEQRAIVAHIALETAKVGTVRAVIERTIVLIEGRRAAFYATGSASSNAASSI